MNILFHPHDEEAHDAPKYIRVRALKEGKQVLKIVWDKESGYPEHAWGFTQWSIRPYEQRYGCDGTTDLNIHLIALRLCEAIGIDYPALYEQAYNRESSWLRNWTPADWKHIERETIVPELSEQALRNLLHDLGEINNRSILAVLEDKFTKLGHNVADWWKLSTLKDG